MPKKNSLRVRKLKRPAGMQAEIEGLVKAGVERFILEEATIHDFLKTIRSAARKESASPHQLTRSVFSRIVKQAVRKRKQRLSKPGRP